MDGQYGLEEKKKTKVTISGFVEDSASAERLAGANIYILEKKIGAVSNNYGFFSITIPSGKSEIYASFVGYKKEKIEITGINDTTVIFKLSSSGKLDEVIITAERNNLETPQISTIKIPLKSIETIPVIFSEKDILKTIQLLPGVQGGIEGTAGIYVRGGSPEQNLILLDDVPVYNVNHLFGIFSVFNTDALQSAELIKGGFPARYGGRVSSILNLRMKEGNNKEFHGEASISLISSKISIEGPIIKNKSSFFITGRRTYIDLFARPFFKLSDEYNDWSYHFYDITCKINYTLKNKDRLFLSIYTGRDPFSLKIEDDYTDKDGNLEISKSSWKLGWGNITTSARWNHVYNNKLFSNTTIVYSKYNFYDKKYFYEKNVTNSKSNIEEYNIGLYSGINTIGGKIDFDFIPNQKNYLRFGIAITNYFFNPGTEVSYFNDFLNLKIDSTKYNDNISSNELSIYFENQMELSYFLNTNIGIRYNLYEVRKKIYHTIEPRLLFNFKISDKISAKASYIIVNQNIHLLTHSTINLPTDFWVPVTEKIKPIFSNQYTIGLVYQPTDDFEINIEGYYKNMNNLIEYKEGASYIDTSSTWENKIETGIGKSYGIEFFLNKKIGKINGWISYTLSKTERQFENINFGQPFPFKYDRRHDISIVVTYKLKENIEFAVNWVFATGNAVTLATENYRNAFRIYGNKWPVNIYPYRRIGEIIFSCDYPVDDFENLNNRNNFIMPPNHRLDIGINLYKQKKHCKIEWSFGIYNVYNRHNPLYIFVSDGKLYKFSLLPIIPSLQYTIKF